MLRKNNYAAQAIAILGQTFAPSFLQLFAKLETRHLMTDYHLKL